MNVFVQLLASDSVDAEPTISATKFDVEDNVGESVHVHLRNLRLELSIDDYERLTNELIDARRELTDGDR